MATGTLIVQIDNELLTLLMQQGLKQARERLPFPITNVAVVVHADAPIEVRAGTAPLRATIHLMPQIDAQGRLDLRIAQARLFGFLSVPGFVNRRLAETINTRANETLSELTHQDIQGMHVRIIEVHTIEGALVATAEVVPAPAVVAIEATPPESAS